VFWLRLSTHCYKANANARHEALGPQWTEDSACPAAVRRFYLSVSLGRYVSAALQRGGYAVDMVDLNALCFRSRFTTAQVRAWRAETIRELAELERSPRLDIQCQRRLVKTLQRLSACEPLDPERAAGILRSEAFYDFSSYLWRQVRTFEKLLSEFYPPYDYFSAIAVPPFEANSDMNRQGDPARTADRRFRGPARRTIRWQRVPILWRQLSIFGPIAPGNGSVSWTAQALARCGTGRWWHRNCRGPQVPKLGRGTHAVRGRWCILSDESTGRLVIPEVPPRSRPN
jgi:hypothetical protein